MKMNRKPKAVFAAGRDAGAMRNARSPGIAGRIDFLMKLTACNAFEREMHILEKLFNREGLEVICAACRIGRVSAQARGVPELSGYVNATCNSVAQAEILNREQTELNFIVGLCMGHDILFTRYSTAPVSTLIVKDRMAGNNPAAALYGYHARKSLFKLPRMDKQKV